MVDTLNLRPGDEIRITATCPTTVTLQTDEKLHDPLIVSAITARDQEIARLRQALDDCQTSVADSVQRIADAIIDRLIERLQ
jgi:hypothetical protein